MRKTKLISILLSAVMLIGILPSMAFAEDYSNTGVRDFVERLYNVVLDRPSDPIGLPDWYNRINSGSIAAGDAAVGFFHSTEYAGRNRSDEEFVTDLYNTFLNRGPDAIGKADWTGRLASGQSRDSVMSGFIWSTEFRDLCASYGVAATGASTMQASGSGSSSSSSSQPEQQDNTADIQGFVTRLYNVALGRNPDATGLADWTNRLTTHTASPANVARGFIFSDECIAATTDNTAFVTVLYNAILGRNPDATGLADWTGRLANGTSRNAVFEGFVNSVEFRGICESYGLIRVIDPTRPMVALTFDDGPGPRTNEIVNVLEQTGQAATFFVCGSNARYYPDTLRHMDAIGCEIGNHTYDHPYLTRLSGEQVASQMARTNEQIRAAVGHDATVMRPPYGAHNATVDANVGYPLILWSIDTRDWATRNTQSTIDSVLNNVRDGDIILMHDIHTSTVDAALYLIPELQRRGYQVVTVSELAEFRGGMSAGTAYSRFRP